jgi:hypothetical protein
MMYCGYENWKGWSSGTFGRYWSADAEYFRLEIARTGLVIAPGLQVPELGFGDGTFAAWAQAKHLSYTGTELMAALVERATLAGIRAVGHEVELRSVVGCGTLDLAVAFDVLEHLELDAMKAMQIELRGLLRAGGCVLARVPSGDSPFGRAVFHGDLTHRRALGSSAIRQLAALCAFDVVDIGPPSMPLRRLGLQRALRRAAVLATQRVVAKAINLVFHDIRPE